MIRYIFPVQPVPKGRPRMTRNGHTYTPQRTRSAEDAITISARTQHTGEPMEGAVQVTLVFEFQHAKRQGWHTSRPDLDNLTKLVTDACNGVVWKDDSQIAVLTASKIYTQQPSCITMYVDTLA